MAGKIPVGGTIARAYGFAFGNIVNNLGAIWIPIVIIWALLFLFRGPYLAAMTSAGNPQAVMRAAPFFLGMFAVSIVLVAAMMAGITKEALGLRTGSAFLQNPFGGATWRVLGSYVLFILVMLVLYILFVIASLVVAGVTGVAVGGMSKGGSALPMAVGLIAGVIFVIGFCAFVFVAVRLSFLLVPVAVAERVSLTRAWQLTKGNFWRILAIMIVLVLPLFVLEVVLLGFLLGGNMAAFGPNPAPEQIEAMNRQMISGMQRYWYIYQTCGLVISLIFYGMFSGAASYAYRAVTHEDRAPEVF